MDQGPEEYSRENWLKEYVDKRGVERVMETSWKIFHRFRVVEQLVLRQDEVNSLDRQTVEQKAKSIVEKENRIRQENIRDFKMDPKGNPENADWYVPFDLTEEVIAEGVRWYEKLKTEAGNFEYVNIGLSALIKDVYRGATDKLWVEERMRNMKAMADMSNLVGGFVGDRTYSVEETGEKQVGGDPVAEAMRKVGGKLDLVQENLGKWISGLGNEINGLYAGTATKT